MRIEGNRNFETRSIIVDRNSFNHELLIPAAVAARDGLLVAFPTDTVYGIGTNALLPESALDIFAAKARPADKPLILLIADPEDAVRYVIHINDVAKRLMRSFWPGPLTLVFKKADIVPDTVAVGEDTIGVRCPDDDVTRTLIRLAGIALATTSANISDRPSPTMAKEVEENLSGKVSYIIDGGRTRLGVESTVVNVSWGVPAVIREGALSWNEIIAALES